MNCAFCDEPILEGQDVREYPDLLQSKMHKECADEEARCPKCGEPIVLDVMVRTMTVVFPSCDPATWNDAVSGFDNHQQIMSLVEEDPSYYKGIEKWSCQNCGHVLFEKEEY